MNTLMPIPQNYKNTVDWILGAYADAGVSFPNGFQKDAIQNAVGARKTNKFKDWRCDISLVSNEFGTFVIIEDICRLTVTSFLTMSWSMNQRSFMMRCL